MQNSADGLLRCGHEVLRLEVILLPEEDTLVKPAGVKGIGELSNVGTNAAIAKAIYHAAGKGGRHVPFRLEQSILGSHNATLLGQLPVLELGYRPVIVWQLINTRFPRAVVDAFLDVPGDLLHRRKPDVTRLLHVIDHLADALAPGKASRYEGVPNRDP